MTLKEAYDEAKEGQRIKRKAWTTLASNGFKKDEKEGTRMLDLFTAMADDWEVIGEKKKAVIEDVMWEFRDFGREISPFVWKEFPDREYFLRLLRNQEIGGIKMKMTLEWEEP